jgi:hypothetical protein
MNSIIIPIFISACITIFCATGVYEDLSGLKYGLLKGVASILFIALMMIANTLIWAIWISVI